MLRITIKVQQNRHKYKGSRSWNSEKWQEMDRGVAISGSCTYSGSHLQWGTQQGCIPCPFKACHVHMACLGLWDMDIGVVNYFQAERSHESPHSLTCYSSHGGISQDGTSLTWVTEWLKLGKSLFWQIWTHIFFCLCVLSNWITGLTYPSTDNVWSSTGRSLGWKSVMSKWRGRWGPWW